MKTTIDLADPLFHAAKTLAAQQKTTLRALVEEGLRLAMAQRKEAVRQPYKYQDFSVKGDATSPSNAASVSELEMQWALDRLARSERYALEDRTAKQSQSAP